MTERNIPTNYYVAVHWCHNHYVMCNSITEIDPELFDNARFPLYKYEDKEYCDMEYNNPEDYAKHIEIHYYDTLEKLRAKRDDETITDEETEILEDLEDKIENPEEYLYEKGEEIYQYFLTDCTEFDVEYLEDAFGLLFAYSDLLGLYVLCVNHWGTGWDYVRWYTNNENARCELGEKPKLMH